MNFGALPEGKVGLGIPHGAPPPLVWGTQIIQEFNEGLVLRRFSAKKHLKGTSKNSSHDETAESFPSFVTKILLRG